MPARQPRWAGLLAASLCAHALLCCAVEGQHGIRAVSPRRFRFPRASRDILRRVYEPRGFTIRQAALGAATSCWVPLRKAVSGTQLFTALLASFNVTPEYPPPRNIPRALEKDYLLDGLVNLLDEYHVSGGGGLSRRWGQHDLATAKGPYEHERAPLKIQHALQAHPVTGLRGAVVGSESPWIEAILLDKGATHITTIEFTPTDVDEDVPNLTAITPKKWAEDWLSGTAQQVDFVFTFSSIEHTGLGRYGDPLDPWGDVSTMLMLGCYVREGGLVYLGIPAGAADGLAWNAHRIYGPVRWPLVTANWELVGVYGAASPESYTCESMWAFFQSHRGAQYCQEVVVLRNLQQGRCE